MISLEDYMNDENRPVDVQHYPQLWFVHAYTVRFKDQSDATYYILECADGFHFSFSHPCDEVTFTQAEAERALFSDYVQNNL